MDKELIIRIIGIVMIVDGIWSLNTKKNNHTPWYLDVGRVVRVALGGVLLYM